MSVKAFTLVAALVVMVSACSTPPPAYLSAKSLPPLLLPDTIDGQRLGQLYPVPASRANPLPAAETPLPPVIAVQQALAAAAYRFDGRQWVTNAKSPAVSWSQLIEFWRELDVPLARQDVNEVVLETQWFTQALQPGFEIRYQLHLQRGLQPENTEIYLVNQKREHHGVVRPWSKNSEDDNHSQWLISRLLERLNDNANRPADSLLATTITLPRKVFLDDRGDEPVLSMAIGGERSVQAIARALSQKPLLTYDSLPGQGVFHIHNRQNGVKKTSWLSRLNPFSGADNNAFVSVSPYPLAQIVQHLVWDNAQVQLLFEQPEDAVLAPLSKVPGYLMVVRPDRSTGGSRLFVRDTDGLPIGQAEARKLLSMVWRQLI